MSARGLKGSVTVFVLMILGLIIGLYIVGFQAPIVGFVETNVLSQESGASDDIKINESFTAGTFLNATKNAIFSDTGKAFLGITLIFSVITGVLGAGAIGASIITFMIPAFLLFIVANIFFFPVMSDVQAHGLPFPLDMLILIIFNVLLLLAILSFITGKD